MFVVQAFHLRDENKLNTETQTPTRLRAHLGSTRNVRLVVSLNPDFSSRRGTTVEARLRVSAPPWFNSSSILYQSVGGWNRARNSCVVLSAVRLLDHIRYFPSGEKTGRPSKRSQ